MWGLLIIAVALAGLVVGADWTVRGATTLARRAGWSPMMIGLTVISIGTSLPEIGTNLASGFRLTQGIDASGIAVGNIVGSNLSQITLLLGVVGFFATLQWSRSSFRWDGMMVLVAAGLMWLVCVDGTATRLEGLLLVCAYAAYLASVWWRGDRHPDLAEPGDDAAPAEPIGGLPLALLGIVCGLALVAVCADQCVTQGVGFARRMGIGEEVIGLAVGVGTGLPELTVSLRAMRSGEAGLSLGNLLGSNITDPLLSFGAGVCIHDVTVTETVLRFDFPYWLGVTGVALLLLRRRFNLTRPEAAGLVGLFALFVVLRWALF
ncbi:MAG: sodium:calcium antiporter [Planctomycetota bacterium]|jgi:cation:H+ antiporter